MSQELSPIQIETLKKPCPVCGSQLREVGDLSDFDHNIIACSYCEYALLFDGSTIN